ncbi:MAG: helix-hairpin-helix domain-containing protein [Candidatus Thorarchaeota archaeon]|jgi:meiotic recombination protein SPO11
MAKKKKKTTKKPVQTTLGEVVQEKPKKKPAKKAAASKKKTTKKTTKPATKKADTKKKAKSSPKKTSTKKKTAAKKKTPTKKKTPSKKKKPAAKKPKPIPPEEGDIALSSLPGVGGKLAERLRKAGYVSVEKISRARSTSLSKKIEGLSSTGAAKLVADAKRALKPATTTPDDEDADAEQRPSLSEIPGIGGKMAKSLESAGYNSIARLSRASPSGVASRVDGLGLDKATRIVAAARQYMKDKERSTVMGEPETVTVTSAKTQPTKKDTPTKKDEAKEEPEKPKEPPKKKTPEPKKSKKSKKKKSAKKKPKPPPKKTKPKVIRKKSGLPVPKAVEEFAIEMKAKWREAERRTAAGELPVDMPETVEVVSLGASDTSDRLVETALEVLNEAKTTGRPAFEIPSRSGDNIVWDEFRDLLLLGMKTISRPYHSLASVVDATRTARVMEIIFQLLKSNLHATKREVFYSDVNLFRDQKYSDKIIEDVSSMLNTTRDSVHVVASARGSAMGRVTIRDGGDLIDLTKMGTGGWAITPFLDQLEIVESDAEFILMAEKDAAIMRLAEAKYWNRQPCIILTGKGSGDIATRAFLKKLVKELEIPAFALVDSDPYGHYIYSVFLRGSKRLSYESPFIATPELKLLGVLTRDLDAFNIPKSVRIPMEPTDIKRVKEMLKEPFVQQNKEWVKDLQLMLKMKEKAEIQAFAAHSFEYLTDEYLPTKLETGDWI